MDIPPISRDDLQDVLELTQKLENNINRILKGNETTIAMSALMSSAINVTLAQCRNLQDVIFFRDIFSQIFDSSIKKIKLK